MNTTGTVKLVLELQFANPAYITLKKEKELIG